MVCFDEKISEKAIREIAFRKPFCALFRDNSFKDCSELTYIYKDYGNE